MKSAYRDIVKHSAVYGLGQILARLASFLLLPLYTSYLRPADYGVIAILDLTAGIFGIVIGAGMASAVNRYHFEAQSESERDRVWWTGLTIVALTATVIVVLGWLLREALADVALGSDVPEAGYYFALMLATLWFGAVGELPNHYLRVRKWSILSVSLALVRLVLNISLNVFFLVGLRLGIAGVLWGNLITGVLYSAAVTGILAFSRHHYAFSRSLAGRLWRFGAPLLVAGLLQLIMHQADRYLLRLFVNLHDVGIYSLAYAIGQGVNTLLVVPFGSIWGVVIYEVAEAPGARQVYQRVYEYFMYSLLLLVLGISLFSRPLIALMAAPEYAPAAKLIPIVCLAYVFFSVSNFFNIPALVAKQTRKLIPGNVIGSLTKVGANLVLIPLAGVAGAAWASVLTFVAFSVTSLIICRRIDRIDYPLARLAGILGGMVATYVACDAVWCRYSNAGCWIMLAEGATWLIWASVVVGLFYTRGDFASFIARPTRVPLTAESVYADDTG